MYKGRAMCRKIRKAALILFSLLLVLVIALSSFHHIMLRFEKDNLSPPGGLYSINGHQMHLYTQGTQNSAATIVFLSGCGTAAPVYDFKVLYTKLSSDYRIAVVERSGYGYSEISGAPRDIATAVDESRSLLAAAGEKGPYILMAHSISGLEALYWAQEYPDEIKAIIGLDMSVPQADIPYSPIVRPLLKTAAFLGLQRIAFLYPVDYVGLTDDEMQQAKYLTYKNAFNADVAAEMSQTQQSIQAIRLDALRRLPILDFVSDDEQSQKEHKAFSKTAQVESVQLNTGHYVHHFESGQIAAKSLAFLRKIGC